MKFKLLYVSDDCKARAGEIETDHGKIETPIFMPVGTIGSVKAVHRNELERDVRAQIILGNTYHLYLRPGLDVIRQAGGIQKFNSWNKPMLTDSGGFQVYSLGHRRKITEEGCVFRSHIDGSKHIFTPERVMDIQRTLGADIIMAFDECTPYPCDYTYAKKSLELTNRWLDRCVKRFDETECEYGYKQTLFPIVQGSVYNDLRKKSCEYVASLNREGNAIGGLSVGEPVEMMYELTELCCDILPKDKPRYLMGVGTPINLLEGIARGIDMFDCVMPTRNGRNGMIFTWQGVMNLRNKKWEDDFTELDPCGTSWVDHAYSRAYVRHLIHAGEMLGLQILSIHNLAFYLDLVTQARQHILAGDYESWMNTVLPQITQRM